MEYNSIAAKEGRKAMKLDIEGAYLSAEMTGEEDIMELDKMLTRIVNQYLPELELLVCLDKALYCCIQSAKLRYEQPTEPNYYIFRREQEQTS